MSAISYMDASACYAVGALLSIITPNKRPFSLSDPSISFPNVENEKISTVTVTAISLAFPAVVVVFVCLVLVPGPSVSRDVPKSLIWKRKLWELFTGWLGLGLSTGAAFLITGGMKNLFGRQRPFLLSACAPNLADVAAHAVSRYPDILANSQLVSHTICTNTDSYAMNDAFRSFPSGHSSFSAAGLIYLSLFIASKLAISIPYLAPRFHSRDSTRYYSAFPDRLPRKRTVSSQYDKVGSGIDQYANNTGHDEAEIAARNQAASPPLYLLTFAVTPFFTSIYICSTRYSDFKHHGFDILFGFFIGIICAIFAFRFYHLPMSRGAGWSYGPRSHQRAFWAGVGVGTYVGAGESDFEGDAPTAHDPELGGPLGTQTSDVSRNQ